MKAFLTSPDTIAWLFTAAAAALVISAPLIATYAVIAARKVAEAAGVTFDKDQLIQLRSIAAMAVAGVEEYVRSAAKLGLTLNSNEKLDLAARMMRDFALDGLKRYTDAQLKAAAESQLPELRAKSLPPPAS